MRLEHRILQRVRGIFGVSTADHGEPVQLPVVTVEQLLERVLVAGDVCCQQLSV
jgi:hypothetical protein